MKCKFCSKQLRRDNKIGTCRTHRALSDGRKEYMTTYFEQNKDSIAQYKSNWSKKNSKRIYAQRKESFNEPSRKLAHSLRTRINRAIKSAYKTGSAIECLGCSIQEFKEYMEKQFQPNMTWKNHSQFGWHIDHIIPLSSVNLNDPKQFKKVCHYTNLRPLWWYENLSRRIEYSQE